MCVFVCVRVVYMLGVLCHIALSVPAKLYCTARARKNKRGSPSWKRTPSQRCNKRPQIKTAKKFIRQHCRQLSQCQVAWNWPLELCSLDCKYTKCASNNKCSTALRTISTTTNSAVISSVRPWVGDIWDRHSLVTPWIHTCIGGLRGDTL